MSSPETQCITSRPSKGCQAGYTLVEVVSVLIILAVLAAYIVPRLSDRGAFNARIFYDEALSSLRHAQKLAIAQNRPVYVHLDTANGSIAYCFAAFGAGGSCDTNQDKVSVSGYATLIVTPSVSDFYFDASGKPFYLTDTPPASSFPGANKSVLDISVSRGDMTRVLSIEQETGYVHP